MSAAVPRPGAVGQCVSGAASAWGAALHMDPRPTQGGGARRSQLPQASVRWAAAEPQVPICVEWPWRAAGSSLMTTHESARLVPDGEEPLSAHRSSHSALARCPLPATYWSVLRNATVLLSGFALQKFFQPVTGKSLQA